MKLLGKLVCLFREHTCAADASQNWRTVATQRQCRRCGQWMRKEEFYVGEKLSLRDVDSNEIVGIRQIDHRWVPMTTEERVARTLMGETEPSVDDQESYDEGMNWIGWTVLIFLLSGLAGSIAGLLHALGVL